jgi:predicted MFS family arabinose efflux permease
LLIFCIAWNLGVTLGQTAGGWLFSLSRQLPMAMSATAMALVLVLTGGNAPEPADEPEPQEQSARCVSPERARAFVYLGWTSNVASALSVSLVIYLFPQLAEKLAISPHTHGMMLASQRAVLIITFLLMWHFKFWQYRLSSALTVQGIAIVGLLLVTTGTTVPVLTVGIMLVGVLSGYNYFAGMFYSTTGFADDQKVMASSMHEATLAVGVGVGSLLGGVAGVYFGERMPYLLCGLAIVVFSGIQWALFASWRRRWGLAKP